MMTEAVTNLRVLKPSRKKPKPGDVFALQLADEEFLFGRVISTDAKWTLAEGAGPAVLIYLFRERSREKAVPDAAVMGLEHLLVSPIMTNQLPWSRGYFETLANIPLAADDVLPRHCFHSASRGRYFDEHGTELPGPIEPVGANSPQPGTQRSHGHRPARWFGSSPSPSTRPRPAARGGSPGSWTVGASTSWGGIGRQPRTSTTRSSSPWARLSGCCRMDRLLVEPLTDPDTGEIVLITLVTDNGGPVRSLWFESFIATRPELRHVRTRVR